MPTMIRHARTWRGGVAVFLPLFVLAIVAPLPAPAQQDMGRRQLEDLRQRIEQERRKQARLRQEKETLEREMARIKRDLAEKAGRIQALEQEIAAHEKRLHRLEAQHGALLAQLARNRAGVAQLLAALQRLRGDPPPPFVTHPREVLRALRSALAMRALLPRLRRQAQDLRERLEKLVRLRDELEKARAGKKAQQEQLRAALARMDGLLRVKADLLERTRTRLRSQERRLAGLLRQARSLEELLRSLDREGERRENPAPPPDIMPHQRDRQQRKPVFTVPFPRLKGRLPWPAQGRLLVTYGQHTPLAGISRGIYLGTRPGALVTAPAGARVEVAGPFRSYGKLVILDMGQGYRILLAGMEKTVVRTGETIRAGEPVGYMGRKAQPATVVDERIDANRPILYMELRNRGRLLDPARWLAGARNRAHKG